MSRRPVPIARHARRTYVILPALLLCGGAGAVHGQGRLAVLEEPGSTAVGVALLLSAADRRRADDEAGLVHLAALALLEQLRPRLAVLGARAVVECHGVAIGFTLLAPSSTWRTATELLTGALFDYRVEDAAVERARAQLAQALALEEGNPASEARHALERALYGEDDGGAARLCGPYETLPESTPRALRRVGRARFDPSRAAAAVAGPVTRNEAQSVFRALTGSRGRVRLPAPERRPGDGRYTLDSNTVTTWAALAFPFPEPEARHGRRALGPADMEALRLLAFRLRELAAPSPVRPDVYDASTQLTQHGEGGVLSIYLVTTPERAPDWANRIEALVDEAAGEPLSDAAFGDLLRRYRGARLLELATPEARAREAARQLLFENEYRPVPGRIDALTPERLRRAAAALGAPATVLLGPTDSSGRSAP